MPGRTPQEAARAFLGPLQAALGCVVHGKIVPTPGGWGAKSGKHAWTLNGDRGAELSNGLLLKAKMNYHFVEEEDPDLGPWRVTTDGYIYTVEQGTGVELLSWHWHPESVSPHRAPHAHFAHGVISEAGSFLERTPMPTGRMTLEEVIRYVIRAMEAEPLCTDWENRLTLAEAPHRLYRSWNYSPEERQQQRP